MRQALVAFIMAFLVAPVSAQQATPEKILNGLKAKWEQTQDYHCKMRSRNRVGEQKDEKKLEFWFKKPHQVRSEVIDGDKKGSVLTRDAAGKIRGKKGGVLGIVAVTLGEDDERITNLRGRKFYLADWGSVIKEYFQASREGAKFSMLPDDNYNNVPCYVIQADLAKPMNRVTRDMIWVDKQNNIILCRKQFEGNTLVNEVAWWDVEVNVGVPDSQFSL